MNARRRRLDGENPGWEGVEVRPYKPDPEANGPAVFHDLTRQVLFDRADQGAQIRYFDVAPGGRTSLERHGHPHAVVVLDGHGSCLVDDQIFDLRPMDLVEVGAWEWHQFRAASDDRLGFLCVVDRERDRPETPGEGELAQLARHPTVAQFLGISSSVLSEPAAE